MDEFDDNCYYLLSIEFKGISTRPVLFYVKA